MAVRKMSPTTPAQRGMTSQDFDQITTNKPVKSLLITKKQKSGRNNTGRITSRHRGGGAKRFIRIVDFNPAAGTTATVEHIEYDPGRSARIARLKDDKGNLSYVIATSGMHQGQIVKVADDNSRIAVEDGNRMKLRDIPLGSMINNIEITAGRGGQAVRAAGASAQLTAKEGDYVTLRLPSGEMRMVFGECYATIGVLGNEDHMNISLGKAGASRHLGRRPKVRGVVMNPIDHPHGGGEGKTAAGRHPVTPWGKPTKGGKTRSKKKPSNRFIVKRRK